MWFKEETSIEMDAFLGEFITKNMLSCDGLRQQQFQILAGEVAE
jgi:hypothetical protein